jgi:hypothetical protein
MPKNRYRADGFNADGILPENGMALLEEAHELTERLIECCRAYAKETQRDLSRHAHLHEYAEISLQAATYLLAGSTSCSISDEASQSDLDRAIEALQMRHHAIRKSIKATRGLNVIRKHDVN